jgi:hypothetical protein
MSSTSPLVVITQGGSVYRSELPGHTRVSVQNRLVQDRASDRCDGSRKEETQMMPMLSTARLSRTLARSAIAAALALPLLLPGLAYADNPSPPNVPGAINAPAGHVAFLVSHATGTQNYVCQRTSSGYDWILKEPAAILFDDNDKQIMTHFAGPTWQANDGSAVKAARVNGVTVSEDAIPWLLLRTTSTTSGPDGGDRLTATTYIQRVNTTGGLAPKTGCKGSTVGDMSKVPYTSDYYFYKLAA